MWLQSQQQLIGVVESSARLGRTPRVKKSSQSVATRRVCSECGTYVVIALHGAMHSEGL